MATKLKLPKTIGETIDLIYELQEQQDILNAQVRALKEQAEVLEQHLRSNFDKSKMDGGKGKKALAVIKRSTVPEVFDWDAFYAYIKKHNAWELLQKRVGSTACRERWNDGKEVPGVGRKEIETISISKVVQR